MHRSVRAVALCALTLALAPQANALRVPLLDSTCDLAGSSGVPTGVAYQPGVGFAVTDSTADSVFLFDEDCVSTGFFNTAGFGATLPVGIAFDSSTTEFVMVDRTADEVYFLTTGGIQTGSCDLASHGITSPTGIGYDSLNDLYVITDDSADEVFFIDDSVRSGGVACGLVRQFDTVLFGSGAPQDISYLADTDEYAIVDTSDDEVYIVSQLGALIDQFDTSTAFGATNATGLVYDPVSTRYFVVDSTSDLLSTVDARGTRNFLCSTSAYLANDPNGMTFNPSTLELVFVDDVKDQVYIIDPSTCVLNRQFGILPIGATDATGIAYIPMTDELAITDDSGNEVFFVDYTTGGLTSSCDTVSEGMESPSSIDYLPDLDLLAISSEQDDGWTLVDVSCNPVHKRSAGLLEHTTSSTTPRGIAYHAGLGNFLVADNTTDDIYVSNFEGIRERRIDMTGLQLLNVIGVTANPFIAGDFFVIDDALDQIYVLSIPALTEPMSLSGKFTSPSATVYLWERGEGRVTGTALLGPNVLPVFGEITGAVGGLAVGAVTPGGTPVSFGIGVAADLNQIFAPAPVNTLTRSF